MDKLDDIDFNQDLKWIMHLRCNEKMTYRKIQASWSIAFQNYPINSSISPSAIKTCFKRSALGLRWTKGATYGNTSYISKPDLEQLKDYIANQCAYEQPTDAYDVLAEEHLIRKKRYVKEIRFLTEIKCQNLADEIEEEDHDEPVRSWLNEHLEELDAKIISSLVVDFDRFISCTADILLPYLNSVYSILIDSHPTLIFGGDESGLEHKLKKKKVVPVHVKEFMIRNPPCIPHFSVIFGHNCIGISLPLFIIIPDIVKCPIEVQPFIDSGLILACSTPSGWQTRNSFLLWASNFINWLSNYRLSLSPELREKKAVLILLIGLNSRENPLALKALKQNNIEVIILPAHTTHLLQKFDVVLARPFKKSFKTFLKENI